MSRARKSEAVRSIKQDKLNRRLERRWQLKQRKRKEARDAAVAKAMKEAEELLAKRHRCTCGKGCSSACPRTFLPEGCCRVCGAPLSVICDCPPWWQT